MAYVYRHIRLDKNVPFYIGIGSDKYYNRSINPRGRNIHWRNIVSQTKYEVEVIMDDLTWEQACDKEVEFIKMYGTVNLRTGPLCNMTVGGDGAIGLDKITRDKIADGSRVKIVQYTKSGSFIKTHRSIRDAAKSVGVSSSTVNGVISGLNKTTAGYIFRYYNGNTDNLDLSNYIPNNRLKKVNQYSKDGKYIKTFNSLSHATKSLGIKSNQVYQAVRMKYFTGGCVFRYYDGCVNDIDTSEMFISKSNKKVDRYDKSGVFIDSFDSLVIAEQKTGVRRSYISACCIGLQRSAGGFIWKHKKNKI